MGLGFASGFGFGVASGFGLASGRFVVGCVCLRSYCFRFVCMCLDLLNELLGRGVCDLGIFEGIAIISRVVQ